MCAKYDKLWNQEWQELGSCRQTKRFWPHVDLKVSKSLLKLTKPKLKQVVQLITGHGFNKYHLSLQGDGDSNCRYCGKEVEETWHLVMECHGVSKTLPGSVLGSSSSSALLTLPNDLVHLPKVLCHLVDAVVYRQRENVSADWAASSPQSPDMDVALD